MVEKKREQPISPEQISEQEAEFQIEQPISPEIKETESQSVKPEKIRSTAKPLKKILSKVKSKVVPDLIKEKSETFKQIEDILSEGLSEIYQELPDDLKQEFKEKGEETSSKIEQIIGQAKIVVHKIVDLIKAWLSILPRVNKFFLEQETKIKTEKILGLTEKKKNSTN